MSTPPPPVLNPQASVVITTKNRKDELCNAITSALAQQGAVIEVLVIDDGSTDGTSELIRERFPVVRLDRSEKSLGLIEQRSRGAKLARAPIIFSIDDDATFSTPHVIAQTLTEFSHPRIGAVAIPFINVKQDSHVHQRAPDANDIYVCNSYIGTAHALRRDVFLKLGGYRGFLIHQGEEGDYCIRMLNEGYTPRLGRADPIHHFESPRRDMRRMDYYGRRNDIFYVWNNVPMPYMPVHLAATTFLGAKFGFQIGRPWRMLRGLAAGYVGILRHRSDRHPVSPAVYRLSRRLKHAGACRLSEIEAMLPPIGGGMT